MPITAQAAIFERAGKPMTHQALSLPSLQKGEALVRITCSTICGSDLHTIRGKRTTPTPTILGHEIIGRVSAVAEEPPHDLAGRTLRVGDRITWSLTASCGACFYCTEVKLPQKCLSLFKYGHEKISERHQLHGGLAEYCHLARGTAIVTLPSDLPDEVACPANCATATVVAALRATGEVSGKTVAIFGAGMLGLTATAMAQQRGAAAVLVVDVNEERLKRAEQFGASAMLQWKNDGQDLRTAIHKMTAERGADVLLEMSGANAVMETAPDLLRIGGKLVLVGSVFPGAAVAWQPEQLVRRLLRIEGVHNYTPADLHDAIAFLEQTHRIYPFASLVEASYSLAEVNMAVEFVLNNPVPRVAVRP